MLARAVKTMVLGLTIFLILSLCAACTNAKRFCRLEQIPTLMPDLRRCDFSLNFLTDMDLQGADFRGALLVGTAFDRSNLSGADLRGARLEGASFREANLDEAKLDSKWAAIADLIVLNDASGIDKSNEDLDWINMEGAVLQRVDFNGSSLKNAILSLTNLQEADLHNADLTEARLFEADLTNANLRNAKLVRATFERANLTGADLTGADLELADLTQANLTGAKVDEEQLTQTWSLEGATMPDGSRHP